MSHRARSSDLACIPLPFQTHHEYRTQLPVKPILADPEFFLSVRRNIRAGDKVTVCRYTGPDFARLREIGEARVTAVSESGVMLFELSHMEIDPGEEERRDEPDPKARYIAGDGEVQWNVGRRLFEVKLGDEIVASAEDKKAAQAIATGQAPLPEQVI